MINRRGCVVVLLISLFWISASIAHDRNRPDLNKWFDQLASKKGLCCSFADGYVVEDADWKTDDGHYQVRIPKVANGAELEWVNVPDEAVIGEPNRAGKPWCGRPTATAASTCGASCPA